MDSNPDTPDDELMLEWATECYEVGQYTGDHELFEGAFRYTEYRVHGTSTTDDPVLTPWLVLLSGLLAAQWDENPSILSSMERAVSINAGLVLDLEIEDEAASNSAQIILGKIFVKQ